MTEFLSRLALLYEARNVRERVLIAATLLAMTWGMWIISVGGSVYDAKAELVTNIDRLASDLRMQSDERQKLQQEDQQEVTNALLDKVAGLERQLVERTAELEEALGGFVAPQQMPALLEALVPAHSGLEVNSIESLAPSPLSDVGMAVLLHPVEMEISVSYFDVLAYLERLEATSWELHWRRVEYVVDEYPRATIRVQVETLSDEEAWLGV